MDNYPKSIYSAPRMFDLASLLVITLTYGMLFAVMTWMMLGINVFLFISGLVTVVAIAQALLFNASAPRLASLLVGIVFGVTACFQIDPVSLRKFDLGYVVLYLVPEVIRDSIPLLALFGIAFGASIGYLAGTCVGGVFLISDKVREFLRRHKLDNVLEMEPVKEDVL
jgi:hypothetical protein